MRGNDKPQANTAFWNDDRVKLLSKLWTDGETASTIAGVLGHGVTRNAVIGKVHRLGLSGRGSNASRNAGSVSRKAAEPPPPPARPVVAPRATVAVALKPVLRGAPPLARMQPMPEPLKLIEPPKRSTVSILQLSDKTCRWPLGDPGQDGFCFCGREPKLSSPYCQEHSDRAFQPPQDRRNRRELAPA